MTIRARLIAAISLLLLAATAAMGYGVLVVSGSFTRRDASRRLEVLANTAQRAAEDALLQKDDLLLVSYLNFLREQYPSLGGATIRWQRPAGERVVQVGEARTGPDMIERVVAAVDPAQPGRQVTVTLRVSRGALYSIVGGNQARLAKIIALVAVCTLALGVLFSFWFARSLTAPLHSLVGLATAIAGGRLGARLEWESKDEIGQLVAALNTMSARLEELDEAKKNFVSSVTHELRSPLGAIESFLHLLEGKLASEAAGESREYLARIKLNVQRLGGFINNLLDVAKIEKGRMECVLRPVTLQEIASDVCQFFEAKAAQQGVQLSARLEGLPAVQADPDRIRQVLVNLVSNALKFTPAGGRIVIAGEQFREGEGRWVELSVADNGRGMDSRDVGVLFAPFSQGRNVAEGVIGTKGTGLGLYIVKSIIEQHGGKVGVKSAVGQGTEIRFSLRAA